MPRFTGLLVAVALAGVAPVAAPDSIDDVLKASARHLDAARASQARVNTIDDETRKLQQQDREAQFKVQQLAAYAVDLEARAGEAVARRDRAGQALATIAETQAELLPLVHRMLAALDAWIAQDLPFQVSLRRQRVEALRTLVDDPERPVAEKYRRVLEVWKTEVDYNHSLGTGEADAALGGSPEPVAVVRVGRVGLFALSADGRRAGTWDRASRRWRRLDDDAVESVAVALAVARGERPPEPLVLPVAVRP